MTARTLVGAAVLVCAGVATVVTAPSADAATNRTSCVDQGSDARVCFGVQTSGGDIRGYATSTLKAGGEVFRVNVRTIELQRRTCGGAWHSWTTAQDPDWSRGTDTAATQYVQFPSRVQFRTKTLASQESAPLAYSKTYVSRVFGSC